MRGKNKSSNGKAPNAGDAAQGQRESLCGNENRLAAPISSKQMEQLDMHSMAFLSKKLVNLTYLLQRDTVADDMHYPSFCC